jgi:hypothetical protein
MYERLALRLEIVVGESIIVCLENNAFRYIWKFPRN